VHDRWGQRLWDRDADAAPAPVSGRIRAAANRPAHTTSLNRRRGARLKTALPLQGQSAHNMGFVKETGIDKINEPGFRVIS